MGGFVKGDIVRVLFRFSDLSRATPRPALVLAGLNNEDSILCQITKKPPRLDLGVRLDENSFSGPPLKIIPSFIRPVRIFTGSDNLIAGKVLSVSPDTLKEVYAILNSIFVA